MATRRMDVVLVQTEIRRPLIRARFVNIEKQKAAVSKMAQVDLPEVAGFEMLEGQMKLEKMNKEIVDAFVEEIVVYAKDNLHEINEKCHEMMDRIVEKMKEKLGVTEQLKAENQMLWVVKMNNIIACAEESVVREVVYV